MRILLDVYSVLLSCPSLECYIWKFINNCSQPVGRTGEDYFPHLLTTFSSFRPVTTAFEDFEFPLDINESTFMLLGLPVLLSVASTWSTPCLELQKTFLGGLFRDLPQGWGVMSEMECGRKWVSFGGNSLLQWFINPSLTNHRNSVKTIEYTQGDCGNSARRIYVCWTQATVS